VFRSRAGIVLTVVVWAICAAGIVSALVSDAGFAPVVLLSALGWFVWLLFWRPCVVTDTDGVEFRNLVRDVRIPFDAIDDVDTRYTLRVQSGSARYSAWGAPAPGGASTLRSSMGLRGSTRRSTETWRDAPRSVRESGSARPGDAVGSASGAPATVIRRELERRERECTRRDPAPVVTVQVRVALVAISAVLLATSVAAIVVSVL